jgi:hypothetical protein
MKVFISWSGETSRLLASSFRDWLPSVIQAVKPYFSPDDIAKGSRWNSEISKELEASSVGIICLTQDNLTAPWIMFEAGALAKKLEKAKVCPIVFGINPTDVKDPLAQFQASKFEKNEIKKVVKMINSELGDGSLSSEVFDSVFEMWWPPLKEKVEEILANVPEPQREDVRSERDLLEEILALSRSSNRAARTLRVPPEVHPGAIEDLVSSFCSLTEKISISESSEIFQKELNKLSRVTKYLLRKFGEDKHRALSEEFLKACEYLESLAPSLKEDEH